MFGYSNEEVLAIDSFKTIHPDDAEHVKNKIEECFQMPGEPVKNVEYRVKHKQGHWVYIVATITNFLHDPAINGIVANITDVTLKKQFEDQLYNINNNIDCVIYRYQLNPDGIDKFIFVSPGSKKIWGVEADAALKDISLIWKLFFEEDVPKLIQSIQESGRTMEEWTGDWRIHHPDGTTRWQRGRGRPQKLADGEIIWDSVVIDITENKLAELEVQRIKQNMESLINGTDDLVWSVSPDMTILSANKSYFNFMKIATGKEIKEGSPFIVEEFGAELAETWASHYQRALNGEKFSVKEHIYDPVKKQTIYSDTVFNPMYNQNGTIAGVACYAKDISNDSINLLELTKTKDELQKIMDSSLDMIISLDSNNLILTVNIACKRILGYEPEELIGQPLINYLFKDDIQSIEATIDDLKHGKNLTDFENRYIRKDGSLVWLIWSSTFDSETQIRYGIARDATEKKDQELKLKLSEQRFKSLVQDGADLIGIIDQQANYMYVSPTVEQILGYTVEQFTKKNAFDFIHPDDKDSVHAVFAKINEIKKIQLPPFRFINKKGEYRWIETTFTNLIGEPGIDGIVANSRDVTERIHTQTALKSSEEKYRELFENNPAPMYIWDFETLQIIDCNVEALIKYGYTREEFLKLSIKDIRPAEDIPLIEEATRSEEEYAAIHKKVWRHKTKNDELLYMNITGHIFDYNGRKSVLTMAIDVTAKLKAEEELRLSETMLAEAQRLAKMGSWNFDFKSDHLTWSDELYNVFGTDKATFLETHQSFTELIDPEYRELVVETSKHTQQTGDSFNIIYSITTTKGEKRLIEEYGYGEKDNSGNIIRLFGTAQDVTERKEAEALIIEANERYEYVTLATSDIIWDWDFATNKVYYASSIEKLLGYPAGERKQDLPFYYDNIHPDDRDKMVFTADDFKYAPKALWKEEYRLKKADGNYAVIHDSGIIIKNDEGIGVRMVGSMRDITKQKEEQEYLKLLSSVITNANDAVLITEAEPITEPGPKIVYVNEAFTKMTGFSVEDVTGKTPRIFQGPNTDRSELDRLGDALKNLQHFETSLINYKKDGEEFWTNFSISPVANEKGTITHFISIQREVTQIKLLELQKALLNELTLLFSNPLDLPNILTDVIRKVAEFAEFELVEAWLLSSDSKNLKRVATYSRTPKEKYFFESKEDKAVLGYGEGFAGKVWLQKNTQYWSNVPENKDYFKRKAAGRAGLQSACGIPLIHNDQIIGVFSFFTSASIINYQKVEMLFKHISSQIALEIKRKQAERELEQLFTHAPDIVTIAGLDGYFKKVNPAFCTMLGLTEEEILATPFMEMIHPDDRSRTQEDIIGLTSSGSVFLIENRYRTKEGKYINISWTATSTVEEGLIFAVGKNVTEKKELEELLANTSAMAQIGSWELNLISNKLYWSPITREIHGVDVFFEPTLETAIGLYKEGENRLILELAIEECITNAKPFDIEVQIITANKNTEKWVKVIGEAEFENGQCTRIYGSFQDIDNLKRNQIALAVTLSEKIEILESIGDAFFAVDKNWTVTYWNHVAEKVLHKKREEVLNKNLWDEYQDAVDTPFYYHYNKAVNENTTQQFEAYYEMLNTWYEVSAYPSENGLSVYFKDVTERKLYEQELNVLNESLKIQKTDLERSNKELEQFAYVASHDLQEPLRMVTSFLSQLEKKYDSLLDEKGKKYIHFAVDGALRMRSIILDLLEYSRAGRIEEALELTDLNEIIEEIKILLKKQITEKKAIITVEKLPLLRMNKTPVRQILQNLIENGLKYVKEGIKPEIDISAVDDGAFWKIIIKDNGIGIKSEYFEKIFLIFQRLHLKDKYSGTGLGLAVTRKIIENHGGTIWLASEEGVGSTFYFTIPK